MNEYYYLIVRNKNDMNVFKTYVKINTVEWKGYVRLSYAQYLYFISVGIEQAGIKYFPNK